MNPATYATYRRVLRRHVVRHALAVGLRGWDWRYIAADLCIAADQGWPIHRAITWCCKRASDMARTSSAIGPLEQFAAEMELTPELPHLEAA